MAKKAPKKTKNSSKNMPMKEMPIDKSSMKKMMKKKMGY